MKKILMAAVAIGLAAARPYQADGQTNLNSIRLTGWIVVTNSISGGGGGGTNLMAAGVYVDFAGGNDASNGASMASAFKHCPGDPAAISNAASTVLVAGTNVFFKSGVTYTLTPASTNVGCISSPCPNQGGIALNWSGSVTHPISYICTNAWGTGARTIFTDGGNNTSNCVAAFDAGSTVSYLVFNNLEFGPIGGSATLPPDLGTAIVPKPGAGIFVNGMLNNSTVANCYFHQLGFWFDQQPMSAGSIYGEGVQCTDWNNLTITNCEFTKMAVGCELQISVASTNLTIANCDFHDALIWCVDLPHTGTGCNFAGLNIVGSTFSNFCQQWSGTNWAGYGGYPHSDGIFDRADSLTTFTDATNNNVYNNVFFDSLPYSNTGEISQEGGTSLNIYNNVFSTANSTPIWYHNDNSVNSVSNAQNFVERIFNNTFYEVDNGHLQLAGYPYWIWRIASGGANQLQVYNNLFYDTAGSANILELDLTNTAAAYPGFKIDYNFYHSSSEQFVYQILTDTTSSNTDLGGLQGYGWETHGITNSTSAVFVDATSTSYSITNNYGLHAGSPAIGAGTNLSAVGLPGLGNDITGRARTNYAGGWDLGAYQH